MYEGQCRERSADVEANAGAIILMKEYSDSNDCLKGEFTSAETLSYWKNCTYRIDLEMPHASSSLVCIHHSTHGHGVCYFDRPETKSRPPSLSVLC